MIEREAIEANLKKAFFPVEERDVFLELPSGRKKIPGYKAIVDASTSATFSVVTTRYRLVENEEAYRIADYIVREIFKGSSLGDFKCYNILMPKSKGSCRIDLIIPNSKEDLFGYRREAWTPFVRISNSYNRTCLLKYEIGFCRWICMNGVIFGQKGITISLNHSDKIVRKEIDEIIETSQKEIGEIRFLWEEFKGKMLKLRKISLPVSSALPIFCKVFDIKVKEDEIKDYQKEHLASQAKQITTASKEYFKELGNNAYAMMNVLSDYASWPSWTQSPGNFVDGYQRRVGRWVDDITEKALQRDFSLSQYIGENYYNSAYYLESLVQL